MCTSIALNSGDFYFGRTLDIECGFGEQVIITPEEFPLKFRMEKESREHFAFMGMAAYAEGYPLYADAFNEKGLCMAGLKFPDNAVYAEKAAGDRYNITPFELIPWVLGRCGNINEARALMERTNVIAVPFSESVPLSPLHWHIADKSGSIVVECTCDGVKICDDPAGVLTNNPPFDFHMTNLRQYINITPAYPESRFSAGVPFSNGFGGLGLPGDWSSCSRFVRAAFLRENSVCVKGEEIPHFFRIAEAVSLPMGCVYTEEKRADLTLYACCMDTAEKVYYYRTYGGNRIVGVPLKCSDKESLCCIPLRRNEKIYCEKV